MESCKANTHCKHCQGEHHSLLHLEATEKQRKADKSSISNEAGSEAKEIQCKNNTDGVVVLTCHLAAPRRVLMAMARIRLIFEIGETMISRALLDSASNASFVIERIAQQIALKRRRVHVDVSGL